MYFYVKLGESMKFRPKIDLVFPLKTTYIGK